ncbi:MAG: PHP domain-containing protein [Halioglobus sp.]|nr:PHP domain-containing protein [Halioglobus sp.]
MLIDFHTHSSASDGALSPEALLQRARARGVALLAITDHDLVSGYQRVAATATHTPRLVPGVELSCVWSGATIHVVGLGIDIEHPAMRDGVARMAQGRAERAQKIARRLEKRGFAGALAGAQAVAGESQLGRPHFARWMVDAGHVASFNEAFDRYLGQGKPGDVKAFWPELAEVVAWITGSGGVAVLAHPLKYRFTNMKLNRLVAAFTETGGAAIEVTSGRQTPDQVRHLQRLADEFELEVSIGSDFHRDAPYSADVGVDLAPFAGRRGVWRRWLDPA